MTERYEVYWIHLPEHTDILTQGYVGLTKQGTKKRFWSHKNSAKDPRSSHKIISKAFNKYGDKIIVTTLVVCDKDYAKFFENKLRPTDFIGWNMNAGGYTPSIKSPEVLRASAEKRKKTMEGRDLGGENHWNWKGGISLDRHIKKPWTPEKRKAAAAKAAEKRKGTKASEETRKKLSQAKIGMYAGNKNPFADRTEHTFVRIDDGLTVTCTRSSLRELFGLGSSIKKLFYKNNPRKAVYGWSLKND